MAHSEARVPPSSIFNATPRPRPGRIAPKTPSAPVLIAARPRRARIISVQARPSPATSSGWAIIASTSAPAAASRARPRPWGRAMRAIDAANPFSVVAKLGAEQPSIP